MSYDRYTKFRNNGKVRLVPTFTLPVNDSDYYEIYYRDKNDLGTISYKIYGDANYDWLIMMANPEYGSMEYNIDDGTQLRVPYPLSTVLEQYNSLVDKYNLLYGI